jgi:P-type Ca2+ transporter type 2C
MEVCGATPFRLRAQRLTPFSCRRIDNQLNIFEGMHRNWFFIAINILMVLCQLIVMFFGGAAFSITRLDGVQWAYSVVLGLFSLPVGAVIRLLPLEGIYHGPKGT